MARRLRLIAHGALGLSACLAAGSAWAQQPARPAARPAAARPAARPAAQPAAQPAAAQPAAPAAQPAGAQPAVDPNEARRAYDEGTAHFHAERFAEALVAFERAYSLRPNPVVLLPILECHQRLGNVPLAIGTLERYLRDAQNVPDRAALEQRLAGLRARPARLTLRSTPAGATVVLDGNELANRTPTETEVPAGTHTVAIRHEGHQPATVNLELTPGQTRTEEVTLRPDASAGASNAASAAAITPPPGGETPPPPPPRRTSPVVWVAAGLAGAGLIAGTIFGVMALSDSNTYEQTPTRDVYDSGRRNAIVSDVSFGVAVLSATIGVVAFFAGRSGNNDQRPAASVASAPRWRVAPNGLAVSF